MKMSSNVVNLTWIISLLKKGKNTCCQFPKFLLLLQQQAAEIALSSKKYFLPIFIRYYYIVGTANNLLINDEV